MRPKRMFAVFVLSVVTVAAIGVFGARLLRRPTVDPWPAKFAVIGATPTDLRHPVSYVAVADPSTQVVVEVPADAIVEIPGTGFLRIHHAYRLGGQAMMRATLARLFAVDVPFAAVGTGGQLSEVAATVSDVAVPSVHEVQLRTALAQSVKWERKTLAGELKTCADEQPCFVLDPASVNETARLIGGLGTKVFVDPTNDQPLLSATATPSSQVPTTPAPTIVPALVSVDVLNAGGVAGAATRTANSLKSKGYNVLKVGDRKPQTLSESVVYFKADSRAKAEQVASVLGYPVRGLPEGFSTSASVVVMLGDDAKV